LLGLGPVVFAHRPSVVPWPNGIKGAWLEYFKPGAICKKRGSLAL
jgi:hypothetical protein